MLKHPIAKMRACLDLLPPPGGEVVGECLDEIESLHKQLSAKESMIKTLQNNLRMERWKREETTLIEELDALQAKLYALMLEYCPDEMTPEQIAEWRHNQKAG